MVGGERLLEPVRGQPPLRGQDSRVVNEGVDSRQPVELLGERPSSLERAKVGEDRDELEVGLVVARRLRRGPQASLVPAHDHEPLRRVRERAGQRQADPGGDARHDESLRGVHQTFMPPSTTMSTPVTYELSPEARNSATLAISSGRPRRPRRVLPSM